MRKYGNPVATCIEVHTPSDKHHKAIMIINSLMRNTIDARIRNTTQELCYNKRLMNENPVAHRTKTSSNGQP